ncbi:LysR family transcriptional regulator [Aestuariibius sp. 2305UL40-4]|uniref:LysR family transcriptional regulator n=1 Tax=Aestuariibius violaceus TaxID=3234132 RepID=UPI00398F03A8
MTSRDARRGCLRALLFANLSALHQCEKIELLAYHFQKVEDMNLRSLRIFVSVMELGTLARAAEALNTSQSAASRMLHLLEEEFGVALFLRSRRTLTPTVEAEAFLPEAIRLLSQVDSLPDFFEQLREDAPPALRIICHQRLVNGLVLAAIAAFSRDHPAVPVKLEVQPRRDLGRRVLQDHFDICVSALPAPSPDVDVRKIASVRLGVLLPADDPLAAQARIDTRDLETRDYIALDRSTVVRRRVEATLHQQGITLRQRHEVSTGASAYRLVAEGLGFTFADAMALDPELGGRVCLLSWGDGPEISYGIFRSPSGVPHPMSEAFEDILVGIAGRLVGTRP